MLVEIKLSVRRRVKLGGDRSQKSLTKLSALAGEKTLVRLTCMVIKTGQINMLGQIIA